MAQIPSLIHIQTQKSSLVLELVANSLPRIVHWGAPLGEVSEADLRALVAGAYESIEGNQPDGFVRCGLTPLEHHWWPGRVALQGLRATRRDWSPRFQLRNVSWKSAGQEQSHCQHSTYWQINAGKLEILAVAKAAGLELQYEIEILTQGLWRIRCQLRNVLATPYQLQELGIALPLPLEANEILDTAGRWGKEQVVQRSPINLGCRMRELHHGRTGFDAPGFTFVGRNGFDYAQGEVWALHNAWSGNHRIWVEKMLNGMQVIGASEVLAPGEIELAEGESYQTPWFYALYANGLDDAAQQVQKWMRARAIHPQKPRPVTLNVWEAVYFNHDLPKLQKLAKIAAQVGVERFVLDDGWFLGRRDDTAGLGDWIVDRQVWPNGLAPLADYVRQLGMEFGLWVEPEMINENSQLAREHPEWILGAHESHHSADLPRSWRNQQVLNIAIPQAWEYVFSRLDALITELGITYLKWDHNRDLIEAGTTSTGGLPAVHQQTKAVYRLIDALKRAHPSLEIESCSSGGGRVDLEILQHTDRFWASDCIDPVERLPMMRAYAQIAPPELLGAHVASPISHTTGRYSPLSLRAGTAIFGSFGIEWDLSAAAVSELDELAQWIECYKENRGFLHSGKVVRCATPDPTLCLHGVVACDGSRALYQLTTHDRAAIAPRGKLRFSGLENARRYRIRPLIIGKAPSGLVPAPWFTGKIPADVPPHALHTEFPVPDFPGIVTTGAILAQAGVALPRLHPDQSLLFSVTAVE